MANRYFRPNMSHPPARMVCDLFQLFNGLAGNTPTCSHVKNDQEAKKAFFKNCLGTILRMFGMNRYH
jgi:hypothetical protein